MRAICITLILGAVLLFPGGVSAQTNNRDKAGIRADIDKQALSRSVNWSAKRDRIADLGLSEEAADQLRTEMKQFFETVRANATNAVMTGEQRRQANKQAAQALDVKLRQMLTPEQFAEFRQPPRPSATPRVAKGKVESNEEKQARQARWNPEPRSEDAQPHSGNGEPNANNQ